MPEYEFTLLVDDDLANADTAALLFNAGCDDATFGVHNGVGYGDFVREATNFADAVLSAVEQVERGAGVQVLRVEPDEVVTMADIADRLDRTRESVRLLVEGRRGPGGFPPAFTHQRDRIRLWRWSEVVEWLGQYDEEELEAARFLAALNAALELRRQLPRLHDDLAAKQIASLAGI